MTYKDKTSSASSPPCIHVHDTNWRCHPVFMYMTLIKLKLFKILSKKKKPTKIRIYLCTWYYSNLAGYLHPWMRRASCHFGNCFVQVSFCKPKKGRLVLDFFFFFWTCVSLVGESAATMLRAGHDSWICVTWVIYASDFRHDPFTLSRSCHSAFVGDMTHAYGWHHSFS